jgi:hypothetical protein
MAGDISFQNGQTVMMDQVRVYFEYLFKAEQSGDPFPVDFDAVWPIAYTTKSNAKRALVESNEFYAGEDYHVLLVEDVVKRPHVGGTPKEKIVLTIQCMEYFIARKVRPVFEIYRQCRIAVTQAAEAEKKKAALPYHIRRYLVNYEQVPFGYFSLLQEVTLKLIAPLEVQGYSLPDKMVPDISVGLVFCRWLREVKGVEPDDFATYSHAYEDGRVVQAKLYPNSLLSDFVTHFQEGWLKGRAMKYFRDRDPQALEFLPKILGGPENRPRIQGAAGPSS